MKVLIDGTVAGEFVGLLEPDDDADWTVWTVAVRVDDHGLVVKSYHPSRVMFPEEVAGPRTAEEIITGNPPALREVLRLVLTGRKIDAIRTVRMVANCGLREAKDYVDSWEWLLPYIQQDK